SMTDRKSHRVSWDERFDKEKYPNDTYFLIDTDWDKIVDIGQKLESGIWVDVKGKYEFDTFTTDDGKEIKLVKRIIERLSPLKNGEVSITGVKSGDVFRVFDKKENGNFLGQGKAGTEGVADIRVGWLSTEGGKLYVCKMDGETEGARMEVEY